MRVFSAAVAVTAVIAVLALGAPAAQAYGNAPWCAVTTLGFADHWECIYNSIEECRPHVISGNRGFCNENPYYHGPAKRQPAPRRRRH